MPRRTKSYIAPVLFLAHSILALAGCETESTYASKQAEERAAPRPDPVMVVRHHVGGTHYRAIVRGTLAYVTFAESLIVVDTESGTALASVELMPFGMCGAATQLVELEGQDRMFALLDGTAVCEIVIDDPKKPVVVATKRRQEIGFPPHGLSAAGGKVWISGDGGVVEWSEVLESPIGAMAPADAKARAEMPPPPVRLAATAHERGGLGEVVESGAGLVVTGGRRVLRLSDGSYVGAATWIGAIPQESASHIGVPGALAFILQGNEGAQVGLMGPDVRELCAHAINGTVRRVRVIGDELIAINDQELAFFTITRNADGLALSDPTFVPVKGARDIDAINGNYYAVVGSFGRALWRRAEDSRGRADDFFAVRSEPSALLIASSDRRRVIAGGPEGTWLYTVGDEIMRVNRRVEGTDGRKPMVASSWGKATIGTDKHSVHFVPAHHPKDAEDLVWSEPLGGEIFGVESIGGHVWIWHEHGVDVVTVAEQGVHPDASVRIEGPVRYLFPQRVGNAAAYVSEYGGLGLLVLVERASLPTTPGERILDRDGDGEDDIALTKQEADGAK